MTKWNSAVVFAYGEVGYVCLETLFSMGCADQIGRASCRERV